MFGAITLRNASMGFLLKRFDVDEVLNDLNFFLNLKNLVCFFAEIIRYCRDGVAFVDRK